MYKLYLLNFFLDVSNFYDFTTLVLRKIGSSEDMNEGAFSQGNTLAVFLWFYAILAIAPKWYLRTRVRHVTGTYNLIFLFKLKRAPTTFSCRVVPRTRRSGPLPWDPRISGDEKPRVFIVKFMHNIKIPRLITLGPTKMPCPRSRKS